MNMKQSIYSCFSKYATFKGRASKSEYWWFMFFGLLYAFAIVLIFPGIQEKQMNVFVLPIWLPCLAVTVRRLHDVDKSGWWIFFPIFIFFNPTKGQNRFGSESNSGSTSFDNLRATPIGIGLGDVVYTKIDGIKIYSEPEPNSEILFVCKKGEELIYTGENQGDFMRVTNSNFRGWIETITVNKK